MKSQNDQNELTTNLPVIVQNSADWKSFASTLTKATISFFLKGPIDAAESGIQAFIDLGLSIKSERSPGNLLWILTISATTWSCCRSFSLDDKLRSKLAEEIKKFIAARRDEISQHGIEVPDTFYDRPTRLPIYRELRGAIYTAFAGDKLATKATFQAKIDAGFASAIHELISRSPEFYAPLFVDIQKSIPKGAAIAHSWMHYRSQLIDDFEVRPVFGQEKSNIALSQLYVPLRGTWSPEPQGEAHDEFGEGDEKNIVQIDSSLDDWLEADQHDDWLRLIGGGPGSGKSTTLKAFSRRVSDNLAWRPLYIPLQHIGIDGDLRETINRFFLDSSDNSFVHAPLTRESIEDGSPLLLIFDGLDELAAPGEAAKDVVATFATRLHSLYSNLVGAKNRHVKVVVSGRMPAFQSAMRYLPTKPSAAIETCGFLPQEGSDAGLGLEDQRKAWWKQYALATGGSTRTPMALKSVKLQGLTNEPLLCYLLALSGFANEHWELAADNRNRIYSALIESVYERGWGEGVIKRRGPGNTLSKDDFKKLMETIALAAFLGGDTRVASREKFLDTIHVTDAEEAWEAFTNDNGQDVTNLAMNFYLKSSDKNQRGFEFTHKSFGEYLAAKALIGVAFEVAKQSGRKTEYALQEWFRSTRTGLPTYEILDFMIDEARLLMSNGKEEQLRETKSSFEALIFEVAKDGFPMVSSEATWREIEMQQASAETALWMIANSITQGLSGASKKTVRLKINWGEAASLNTTIERLSLHFVFGPFQRCLSYLDISDQTLSNCNFFGADFSFSDLRESVFVACHVEGKFFGADLEDARFYRCSLLDADFDGATLDKTVFHRSSIRQTKFDKGKSNKIVVSPLTFLTSPMPEDQLVESGFSIMEQRKGDSLRAAKAVEKRIKLMRDLPKTIRGDLINDA